VFDKSELEILLVRVVDLRGLHDHTLGEPVVRKGSPVSPLSRRWNILQHRTEMCPRIRPVLKDPVALGDETE